MLEPRSSMIRLQDIDEKVIVIAKFDASPTGDCRVVAGITNEDELFIEIYKPTEATYQVKQIIFDSETTGKIRLLFRREHQ